MNEPSDLTLLRQLLESGEWECPAEGKKLIPSVLLAAVLNKEINPDGTTRPGEWSQTSRIRAARLYVDLVKHRGEVAAKAVGKSVSQDEDIFDATPDQSRLAAILARLGTDPSLAFLGRTGADSAGSGAE